MFGGAKPTITPRGDGTESIYYLYAGTHLASAGRSCVIVDFGVPPRCELFGCLSEKRERMPVLCVVPPKKFIFCGADFESVIAFDLQ